MENTIQQKKSESQKTPLWVNMVILVGVLSVLLQTFIRGRGTVIDYIFQSLGGIMMTAFIAFIIGLIPYLILKKRIQRAKLIIFSISFSLISIISLFGTFYRNT